MAYLTREQLEQLGCKSLGKNVKISDKAVLYQPELMEFGDNSRVDDFCVLSGNIAFGRNTFVGVFCNLAGGSKGIIMQDFSTLAYGCHVFTQSDDYSGSTMTNSTVPTQYKRESKKPVCIERHCIVGTKSVVFPGVTLAEGCSIGAMSLVLQNTEPWGIYFGIPVRRIKDRCRDLLLLEAQYLSEEHC